MDPYTRDKFKAKLQSFKTTVTDFLNGGKKNPRGYAQLSGLDQGLLSEQPASGPNYGYGFAEPLTNQPPSHAEAPIYSQPTGRYQGPRTEVDHVEPAAVEAPALDEELRTITFLSNEAASLLFEAISMLRGPGPVDAEMASSSVELLENCELLEKQLRGMIGDAMAQGSVDEALLGGALSAMDALQNVKGDYYKAVEGGGPQAQGTAEAPPPPAVNEPGPSVQQPLIDL